MESNQSEEVKKAIDAYEKRRSLQTKIGIALIGGVAAFFFSFNPYLLFFIAMSFHIDVTVVPFVAAAAGAVFGFFIVELFVLVLMGVLALVGYVWFQTSWVPGNSYSIVVENQSLKNLSIRIASPVKCGAWKPDKNDDIVVTVIPGESKKVFSGCRAREFEFSINGRSPYGPVPRSGSCLELTSNLNVVYTDSGWADRSVTEALGTKDKSGVIRPYPCNN